MELRGSFPGKVVLGQPVWVEWSRRYKFEAGGLAGRSRTMEELLKTDGTEQPNTIKPTKHSKRNSQDPAVSFCKTPCCSDQCQYSTGVSATLKVANRLCCRFFRRASAKLSRLATVYARCKSDRLHHLRRSGPTVVHLVECVHFCIEVCAVLDAFRAPPPSGRRLLSMSCAPLCRLPNDALLCLIICMHPEAEIQAR